MKILITTIHNYPHSGGLSSHVTTLKSGLEALGHEVDVFSFQKIPNWKTLFMVERPTFFLNRIRIGKGTLFGRRMRQKLFTQVLKQHGKEYDIVNAQDIFATLASLEAGLPTVSTVHGYLSFEAVSKGIVLPDSPESRYLQEIEKVAYTKTMQVITVDERIRDYVHNLSGVTPVKIHNFINPDQFKPVPDELASLKQKLSISPETKVLLCPRRLTKKNGVIYPLKALRQILDTYPDTLLIYAGNGEEEDRLTAEIKQQHLKQHVRMLGAIPHEAIVDYYSVADVVLVPSVHSDGVEEATSISALEAMGSCSPVVAGAVGGLKEIIDHEENGLLVPEKDETALAEAVIRILGDPEWANAMADRARAKIETTYSHVAAAKKYLAIYEATLEKGGGRS
ncbi:glycosyltransferase family 4 protein [Salisediminibacterium selenitireducens]|uniref:Glycosyl transferase group 1 n=1 Tax=Bacillus selenitireducens (strain ATCC 700615 / DSM 15326 / MLS10) TaxID=439292 RepID=D6Y0I1_BACIE|nr:glycosyltransferase family 4 protein [Salisediminibacterium selenitireducens]ADI00549.1 glycosyl transferase group 1 [[Bacillus] selenitireducens MLS10]